MREWGRSSVIGRAPWAGWRANGRSSDTPSQYAERVQRRPSARLCLASSLRQVQSPEQARRLAAGSRRTPFRGTAAAASTSGSDAGSLSVRTRSDVVTSSTTCTSDTSGRSWPIPCAGHRASRTPRTRPPRRSSSRGGGTRTDPMNRSPGCTPSLVASWPTSGGRATAERASCNVSARSRRTSRHHSRRGPKVPHWSPSVDCGRTTRNCCASWHGRAWAMRRSRSCWASASTPSRSASIGLAAASSRRSSGRP